MTTLHIPALRGLHQRGDGTDIDPRYAVQAVNALTVQGVLSPMAECRLLQGELPAPIETLARLHRRWHADTHDVLIAASGGQLYWMLPGGQNWTRMSMPFGWSQTAYQSSVWSCVAYELNPEGSDAPVDVLLMSNALDGMICVRGDTMEVSPVATPRRFGVIARHAERIWGGAILDDPDMLVYSAPYDPFNWAQNDDYPEDGAGDILQPSWDGDSFTALTALGSQLIALKRTRVWRILGTNPGEYVFSEQFGGGTPYAATVAVDGSRLLMLGREGVCQYDGESVAPWQQEYAREVFDRMNAAALHQACACMHRGCYYCALPLDESTVNNAVLRYDTRENTWLLREGVSVESFLPTEDALYFTSAQTPGRVWLWQEAEDSAAAQPMTWRSGWLDFDDLGKVKSDFVIRLAVDCASPAALEVGLATETTVKWKTVVFQPAPNGQRPRTRSLHFAAHTRRFAVLLHSAGGAPWRLHGGLQIDAESEDE